jgi:hypothetical protein
MKKNKGRAVIEELVSQLLLFIQWLLLRMDVSSKIEISNTEN